jgi:hypothetical protein
MTEESSHGQITKMLIIFFDSRGVVHIVPPGVTVNQKCYLEVLDRLGKRVKRV